ncbi:MAG: LysM peptidoglycan-binding domain-containing protein [Anaerolineae bacterium]|nr:LysM peptidoglycan-binding domain-containing protein [Anaerolineae bacterium]
MTECSSCGAELAPHETRCPTCGKTTPYYHRQRRCLHCGTPVAEQAKTCIICHQPVDNLPLDSYHFVHSWKGIGVGVLIVVLIVMTVLNYQNDDASHIAQAIENTSTPTTTQTPTITSTPTTTYTPSPTLTITPTPTPQPLVHLIESGQTLSIVASLYGLTAEQVAEANDLELSTMLSVGQPLVIPGKVVAPEDIEDDTPPPLIVYVIQQGDTISSIAYEHGTTMDAIFSVNSDKDLGLIFPGQEISVPLSTPTPTLTPTPLPTATFTPQPDYPLPNLLTPDDGAVIDDATLLLNWTSTAILGEDEFYVVILNYRNGSSTEHWTKSNSFRLTKQERPTNGWIDWTVVIKRQIGTDNKGNPTGPLLSPSGQLIPFEWR